VLVGIRLSHGSMDLSTGLLAILLAPEAYWPVRRVGAEFHSAADGAQALADLTAELRLPAPAAAPAGTHRTVVVSRLGYTYPGAPTPVLEGVELVAEPGLTVITGTSGCGKSTLLELVAGVRTPSRGTVEAPPAHLVTQRPFLTQGTVRENLCLGTTEVPAVAIWAALRDVGLDGVVAGLPDGLDTPLGDDGRGLSAGQRARLVLARATLSTAPLLLLDEPTAHLDDAAAALVHDVVRDLARDRTVVVVTHRPELVAVADSHIHLEGVQRSRTVEVCR
jgi:ATP-binding cassette subfamily C protein CydD/ATP-binding cassette subfamily C protein CydCD